MKTKILLFILLAFSVSCSEDPEECIGYSPENVTEVNAPSSGKVNESVEIEVKFLVYNGCGGFERFIESGTEMSRSIEVLAKYEGCICIQDIPTITTTYEFTPTTPGAYELKFKSGPNDYLEVIILVTE